MTSCRDRIAQELVRRLQQIPEWTATRGARGTVSSLSKVLAAVFVMTESKDVGSTEYYSSTLRLGVVIRSGVEHASPTLDEGNEQRYLDRLVTLAEKAVHSSPWPDEVVDSIEGFESAPPGETGLIEALLTVRFQYRHHFRDPEVFL